MAPPRQTVNRKLARRYCFSPIWSTLFMAYLISAPLFSEKFGFSVIAFFISFSFRMQMGISRIWDLGKTLLLLSHRANENTRAYTTRTKTNTTVCTPLLPFWGIKRSQFCLALLHGGERVYSFYFPTRSTTNISVENSSTQMSFSFTHTQTGTHTRLEQTE